MGSSLSFKGLFISTLFLLSPTATLAQDNASLQSCLTTAGVRSLISTDGNWTTETTPWRLRFKANPSAVAYPETADDIASCFSCALNASVKVSALAGGHSMVAYVFGNGGNLVINLAAFQSMNYDATTELFTYGAGVRVGTGATYLWNTAGRHSPHVRHARPGLAGSSIGGGFGSTSRFLGTPMDFLESVEYMLYNGTIAQASRGSDLFWAAQGAGSLEWCF